LQSTEKKIIIFLTVGILEHSPLAIETRGYHFITVLVFVIVILIIIIVVMRTIE